MAQLYERESVMYERFDVSERSRRLRELQSKQTLTDGEKIECEILLRIKYEYGEPGKQNALQDDRTVSEEKKLGIGRDQRPNASNYIDGRRYASIANGAANTGQDRAKEAVDSGRAEASDPVDIGRRNASITDQLEYRSEDVLAFLSKQHIKHDAFFKFVNSPKLKTVE